MRLRTRQRLSRRRRSQFVAGVPEFHMSPELRNRFVGRVLDLETVEPSCLPTEVT